MGTTSHRLSDHCTALATQRGGDKSAALRPALSETATKSKCLSVTGLCLDTVLNRKYSELADHYGTACSSPCSCSPSAGLSVITDNAHKSRTISSAKYCNRRVNHFIYDKGSVSMPFFKSKIINTDNASAFYCFLEGIPFCEQIYYSVATDFKIHSEYSGRF